MNRSTGRKLVLHRETLRRLSDGELKQAKGGTWFFVTTHCWWHEWFDPPHYFEPAETAVATCWCA